MSPTKQYDRTELLDRAVELFRRQGFSATTTAQLVDELGVNRKSMYAEFDSKQGLFEAALERYAEQHLSAVLAPIEAADAGVAAIEAEFDAYATASEGWASGRGCLLCNTAVERAALDPGSGRHVAAYLDRLTAAFHHALDNGQRRGELDETIDIEAMADFLTTMLIGVAASIRAEAPPRQLRASADVVKRVLAGCSIGAPPEQADR